jgi:anti-sigma factor RsiW
MARKCPDYINDLNDYLDGTIDPELCAEIEKHLGQCENCRVMVDTLKQTVTLCRDGKKEALPQELESRLNSLLKERWTRKFGPRQ